MSDIITTSILAKNGESHTEQFENCLSQLGTFLNKEGISQKNILKQTVFFYTDNSSFYSIKNDFIKISSSFFQRDTPPTGFIGQIPIDKNKVVIECTFLKDRDNKYEIEHKTYKQFKYSVLKSEGVKAIFCSGISSDNLGKGVLEQTQEVFNYMEKLLLLEKMNFSNIIRQWNYIENITGFDQSRKSLQNYQIFNDVRSEFYNKCNFINGYPSATGIGMNAGGIVAEFIASEFSDKIEVTAISNPLQHDAYKYSHEVLVGEFRKNFAALTTPKFERAKAVKYNQDGWVFVSGTAAISGQSTIIDSSIEKQTLNTINNIRTLISNENLLKYKILTKESSFTNIRVYIKKNKDIAKVKKIFKKEFHNVDILYLISDICREKLLIEIEGILEFNII